MAIKPVFWTRAEIIEHIKEVHPDCIISMPGKEPLINVLFDPEVNQVKYTDATGKEHIREIKWQEKGGE